MIRFALILTLMFSLSACDSVYSDGTVSEGISLQETTTQVESSEYPAETDGLLRVNYIDVGQGDSILITTPDGVNMLIDAGEGEGKSGAVTSYLDQMGVDEIDTVIATHPHSDHINAMDQVLRSTDVEHFYMPDVSHTTKDFENMLDALEGVEDIKSVGAGDTFTLGDQVSCSVLAPCSETYDDLNDYSVVIKLTYGETDFIFTGDAEGLSEEEILLSGQDLNAEVLKCGHHGSSSSTTPAFVDAVDPQYAVISCGIDNSYGHPDEETLATLERKGVTVLRTDQQGTITIESDGKGIIYKGSPSGASGTVDTETSEVADAAVQGSQKEDVSPVQMETSYIGNVNSKKFHETDCGNLPAEKNRVYFSTREDAVQQGYSPCGNCNP